MPGGYFFLFAKYVLHTSVVMVNPGGTGIFRLVMFASPAPFPPSRSFIVPVPSAFPAPKKYTCRFAIRDLRKTSLVCTHLRKKRTYGQSAEIRCRQAVIIMNRMFRFQPKSFPGGRTTMSATRRMAPATRPLFPTPRKDRLK